jgi:hypothetical protein
VHRSCFRGQSVVIETQEAAKRSILPGSFDTADSLQRKTRFQDIPRCTDALCHTFGGQSVVIRTQQTGNRCILPDSFDTADSFSEKNLTPRHFEVHRRTSQHFQRAMGCNKDARSSQQIYIARFIDTTDSFSEKNSIPRHFQVHRRILEEVI